MLEPAKVSVTFQDIVTQKDLCVRFRMPAVPRVGEILLLGAPGTYKSYEVKRVTWKPPGDFKRQNEMDVYASCALVVEE